MLKMKNKEISEKKVDMLNGPVAMKILLFALPVAVSGILQQLFNAADVAVVGKFAGGNALAAVGGNSPLINLFIGAFTGLSIGTNIVIAQMIGRRDEKGVSTAVHTSMLFAAYSGLVLMIAGMIAAPMLLHLIGSPDDVIGPATLYLRIYFIGAPFAVVYNFGAAVLRSVGDTRRPMICLILTGVVNLLLNLVLVIVFRLGVAGVGIATTVANVLSAVIILRLLCRETSSIRLQLSKLTISRPILIKILKIGGPAAVQSMVFSIANVSIQGGINSFGSKTIAGSAAALNFELFDFYMITAFNQAAVTFVGQNYAAGKSERCSRITMVCIAEATICVILMISVFLAAKSFWVGLYTSDAEIMNLAFIRMRYVLVVHFMCSVFEILGSSLRGKGYGITPTVITVLGSVVFRVIWLLTVFRISHTYITLLLVYPASWIFTDIMMIIAYAVIQNKMKKEKIPGA